MTDRELLELLVQKVTGIDTRLENVDTHLTNVDTRLENMDTHLTNVDTRLENVDTRLSNVENHLTNVDNRLENVDNRLTNVEQNMATKEQLARIEQVQGEKLQALFDAREVQFDVNERICNSLNRIEGKLDQISLKVSSHDILLRQVK